MKVKKKRFNANRDMEIMLNMIMAYAEELHNINNKFPKVKAGPACEWLFTPCTDAYVCVVDGKPAGFALIGHDDNCHHLADLYIEEFYIKPEYRQKGIGWIFANSIMEKVEKVCFFVMKGNDRARDFWNDVFAAWDMLPVPDTSNAPDHLIFNFYRRRIKK